jgi:hypothetical protein
MYRDEGFDRYFSKERMSLISKYHIEMMGLIGVIV